MNEDSWQSLSPDAQEAFRKAADATRKKATDAVLGKESADLKALKEKGMKVVDTDNGLKLDLFKKSVNDLIKKKFGEKYGELYKQIAAIA
jgi:TRAP-type C4-dicarboxylate transport system substrate-binding protein